ncbi:amino acid ABC transporter, permease protein, His/Glu/Gln/Arg/opine family [Fibrobacter succinogenes subsp. succinogenes S85]|jgi:polar amino acid transport system permease protein|uniref:Glutamate/aspartate import permease protein GltK n=1 Tax=Fibrobacter succinogenes (strain ATCC 19169 / S85) TaxID=59374 RepID=C9RLS5_FIBSS|nr:MULTISPECIES: amino acid ABC transporter permease [Fibrobacter]MBP5439517.1 amino acid ABC transporter permease [Fibrobacter sp.]ACX76090.1 polar amino acid ABC transporter, inner membrane subunit [Fibrobacter succinogenes subsp. succinogenes S85]ADL25459.1 amino acid ABC transporter, permease protein, His/Glu/Gln/Arg/opine family [Fibrobacter succinogenes subsp. succinogenes S85]MDY6332462.1 amino acid ABC transporter permease [Fibrobacter sp.]OWV19517.1 polar amino acid ABC transporter pe
MSDLNSLLPILWGGFCTTLAIFALTLLFSIPLGLLVAVLKMSRYRIVRYPVSFYISVMRGTPLLLQIVAIYFGSYYLSEYTGVEFSFDRFPAVIVAFSINYAAYFAEIFRGGIQSIPKGQYEAAAMLGLTRGQTFYRIILPQVVKRVVPASANEVITLVKDTSLAQVIAVTELFALAKKQQAAYASIYPLFVAGVFYYIANLLLSVLFAYVERKLNYYK